MRIKPPFFNLQATAYTRAHTYMKEKEEQKTKHKKLLSVITAIMMIICFASMLIKATKMGSFGLLLLIAILLMLSQFSGVLEKIFRSD